MLSFHNDQAVKDKYVNRVIAHQKADNLIRGTGWNNGKGCAVGCTLESYDHSQYPIELGIPEWLAKLEDTLNDKYTDVTSAINGSIALWQRDDIGFVKWNKAAETAETARAAGAAAETAWAAARAAVYDKYADKLIDLFQHL
jgi:hypothetical protein